MKNLKNPYAGGLLAGLLFSLSIPPFGWWWCAYLAGALLALLVREADERSLLNVAFSTGLTWSGVSLIWVRDFHVVGFVLLAAMEIVFLAVGFFYLPRKRRGLALVAVIVLVEAARAFAPFGGLPLAAISLGQTEGPLAGAARLGGGPLIIALVMISGLALESILRRRWRSSLVPLLIAIGVIGVASIAPAGKSLERSVEVGVVQGGGARGLRAIESNSQVVFDRHVAQTVALADNIDVVLWPENTVDADGPIRRDQKGRSLSALARAVDAAIIAGVTEPVGDDAFRNAAMQWNRDGRLVDRYDKVHRVPFGEYVPGRKFIDRFVDLEILPRDAIVGDEPNLLSIPNARIGVAISFEVFYADRVREAIDHGAEVLMVPTNAASYRTSQVPTQEVAAAQLRAIESGRYVVQAAPTGYSAVISDTGEVSQRTTLGRGESFTATVPLRSGTTIYQQVGDWPVILLAIATLVVLHGQQWRERKQSVAATTGGEQGTE